MNKCVLCILDGYGISSNTNGNAAKSASMPNLESLKERYGFSTLSASSTDVGLPEGVMGNSEVGHINIGLGRILYQSLELINQSIKDKSICKNEALLGGIDHVKGTDNSIHLLGLLSDGSVHSHINHLFEMIKIIRSNCDNNVYVHVITDGRDVSFNSALKYINQLEEELSKYDNVYIGSISGRYYAMDRDKRYDRINLVYDILVNDEKPLNYVDVINESYETEVYDEFIKPFKVNEGATVKDGDTLMWFNFRADRSKEILDPFVNKDFNHFGNKEFNNLYVLSLMHVSDEIKTYIMYDKASVQNSLGEYLDNNNIKQLRIAETEKYAHVTYFFDGAFEKDYKYCDRVLIDSPKVATYDLLPEMSAPLVTKEVVSRIDSNVYDVIILNYANADMVGHTGNFDKTVEALEYLDKCIKDVYDTCIKNNYTLIITADHGNCEEMLDEDGNMLTSHTTNLVPFIVCKDNVSLRNGKLSDIAPTILDIVGLDKPVEMTGESLL